MWVQCPHGWYRASCLNLNLLNLSTPLVQHSWCSAPSWFSVWYIHMYVILLLGWGGHLGTARLRVKYVQYHAAPVRHLLSQTPLKSLKKMYWLQETLEQTHLESSGLQCHVVISVPRTKFTGNQIKSNTSHSYLQFSATIDFCPGWDLCMAQCDI